MTDLFEAGVHYIRPRRDAEECPVGMYEVRYYTWRDDSTEKYYHGRVFTLSKDDGLKLVQSWNRCGWSAEVLSVVTPKARALFKAFKENWCYHI